MRRSHYIKANKSSEYPRHAIWFDTETTPEQIDPHTIKHHLKFGWLCYRRRARGHRWSKPIWQRFTSIIEFWEIIDSYVNAKESLTLFAHNGSFDLPVLDAFNYLQDNDWVLTNAVIESPPIILKWRKHNRTIRFIDTLNIWRMSLKELGKSIGLAKLTMPDSWADDDQGDEYCKRDVEIIMNACLLWFEFLNEHDLGGFAPTLASQAMRAYTHRFMKHQILIDDDELALSMARESYHGGRTECFYIGQAEGPLYQVDVNSMYPAVMSECMMPTRLRGVYRRVSMTEIRKLLLSMCCIARVRIITDTPVYPQYTRGKLLFPVGEFDTTLTTPELKYAIDNKHVVSIDEVALYEQATIFKEYVDYFYNMRLKYKSAGDKTSSGLVKILLNSLYGKFGQRGRVFETIDNVDSHEIKVWTEYDVDTQTKTHNRQFAGMVQQQTDETESRDSHPAIASHVTAHARMRMWSVYQTAGLENCYYTDTDCVVVNAIGYERLTDMLDETRLGLLKLERTINRVVIYGPKDYQFDDDVVIKGVKHDARWLKHNRVEQEQWSGLKGLIAKGDLTAPTTKTIIKNLKREYTKGIVQPDGFVLPYKFG